MVYLPLHFNRTFTDQYSPMFELFTAVELTFILIFFISSPLVYVTLITARPLHRNFRIFLCHFLMQGVGGMSARLVIMYQQYFGTESHYHSIPLIIASLARIAMHSLFCGCLLAASVERIIATFAWKWYEKTSYCSIFIVLLLDGTNTLLSWCAAWALVFEYITIKQLLIMMACIAAFGAMCFFAIIHYNKQEIAKLKAGAQINRYSVSFAYQIHENLVALRAILGIMKRVILLNIPLLSIEFFIRFVLTSSREIQANFSYALFDVMISFYPLMIASYVPFSDPIFKQSLLRLKCGKAVFAFLSVFYGKPRTQKTSMTPVQQNDMYFTMFNKAINSQQ